MKSIIIAVLIAFSFSSLAYAEAEKKKVCVVEKQKNGKDKEVCKNIKTHKKLEGTKVPEKK